VCTQTVPAAQRELRSRPVQAAPQKEEDKTIIFTRLPHAMTKSEVHEAIKTQLVPPSRRARTAPGPCYG
jgi:hypothetical protein